MTERLVISWLAMALACLAPTIVRGETPAAKEKDPTVKLVLKPAALARASLKYQLLPRAVIDQKPGNAAVHYGKVMMLWPQKDREKRDQKVADWLDVPLDKLPRQEVATVLREYKSVLNEADRAARREQCDWDLPVREGNIFAMLLPELSNLRSLGRVVALKARLEIAEGHLDDAIHTLQNGFAIARHAAQGRTLINGLVGIAIADMMSQRVREFIQQPASPNLYWGLTMLPRPLIDMRPGVECEMQAVRLMFPGFSDIDEKHRDLAYWQRWLDDFYRTMQDLMGGPDAPKAGWGPAMTALALKGYPQAKQTLIAEGRSPQEVEAMPVPEVVVMYTLRTYEELRDRVFQWFFVPYWEARAGLAAADQYIRTEGRDREIVPLASLLLPAISRVAFVSARGDRTIAALRTVEAIRLYGVAHGVRLPEKLADIREVPLPIDPTTGQLFQYRVAGAVATLESPGAPGQQSQDVLRWEIHFVP